MRAVRASSSGHAFALQHLRFSGFAGIGELGRIDRDPPLDQPADGRDVALRVDADRIGDVRAVELEQHRRLVRDLAAHARARLRHRPAHALDVEVVLLRPVRRRRRCRRRRRRRRCGRRRRRAPARAASSPAAPARWGRGSACSRRRRRSRDRRCGRGRRPGCRPARSSPAAFASASSGTAPAPTTIRSAAIVSSALVTTASLPSGSRCRPAHDRAGADVDAVRRGGAGG